MSTLPPVLVLGVDTAIGLTVVRELGRHGVPVHTIGRKTHAIGGASRFATSYTQISAGMELEPFLRGLIRKTNAKALIAISEGDLVALSAMPPEMEGCAILTPRAEPLAIVLDKARTLATAQTLDLDVPESWQPKQGDDFEARAEVTTFPVVLKWADPPLITARLDAAGIEFLKCEIIQSGQELRNALDRYDALGEWPLVQRYAPGIGLGHMIYMKDGRATLRFQHQRIHEWPPEGGVSTLCAALPMADHQAQMEQSIALLAAIGWEGPAMVEYRYDAARGRYCLMEINGRFWGSLPLASACGAEFAWEHYRHWAGISQASTTQRDDLKARFMIPETRRLIRVLFGRGAITDPLYRPTPMADLWRYLAGFIDPRTRNYVFSWTDPGPFLADLRGIIGRRGPAGKRTPNG
jgi:predicted ATP-grasp superfamily ATP-dependent carboligase